MCEPLAPFRQEVRGGARAGTHGRMPVLHLPLALQDRGRPAPALYLPVRQPGPLDAWLHGVRRALGEVPELRASIQIHTEHARVEAPR
jgi:hypothetical protein